MDKMITNAYYNLKILENLHNQSDEAYDLFVKNLIHLTRLVPLTSFDIAKNLHVSKQALHNHMKGKVNFKKNFALSFLYYVFIFSHIADKYSNLSNIDFNKVLDIIFLNTYKYNIDKVVRAYEVIKMIRYTNIDIDLNKYLEEG